MARKNYIILIFLIFTSCLAQVDKGARNYIVQLGNEKPEPSSFVFCSNYGCQKKTVITLGLDSWNEVRMIFADKVIDADAERMKISEAIGRLESIVGPITKTEYDEPGSFVGAGKDNQLDCVDESLNTSTYLVMMENEGLITYHKLLGPAQRGFLIIGGWPHRAPVIEEKETGKRFVVDSWFYRNGEPAVVLPLQEWLNGWSP